jgi:hypothetical protein
MSVGRDFSGNLHLFEPNSFVQQETAIEKYK